jgi:hypothetical protein
MSGREESLIPDRFQSNIYFLKEALNKWILFMPLDKPVLSPSKG